MTTTTTRDYEALVIFKTAGTDQEIARQASQLEDVIKKMGGRIDTTQAMGRRRLAFRIARQNEGHYQLYRFHAPTQQLSELERAFRLNDAIVRFMIVSAEEVSEAPATAGRVTAPAKS